MDVILSHLDIFGRGLLVSGEISAATAVGAWILGLVLATCRVSPLLPLQLLSWMYVSVLRSIPLLVLLTLFVFGLPEIGLIGPLLWTIVLAMVMYWAAFFSDIIRFGIHAVPRGQIEAARALGLTSRQVIQLIIAPQTLVTIIQPAASLLIGIVLNSSLAAAVGVTQELTGQTELLDQQYATPFITFGFAAGCYVAVTIAIGRCAGALERRMVL